ncbi:sensor histidine kinase [Emticicia sp. BO119]|uniref:sensor histidine kinase n=1 Tax=Emticicia sp. BO119 TaxID=2757768 RepID=UPI0015F04B6A|nr:histidine kinase [Emticicia sp. BO119]MBA4850870.1 histidine kinase [Emticicia sp. BO119]
MKPNNFFSNSFFQFIIITLVNFGLGGGLFLLSTLMGYIPDSNAPLGAANDFIFYDNLLESFMAVVVIYLYRRYTFINKQKTFLNYLALGILLYLGKGALVLLSAKDLPFHYTLQDLFFNFNGSIVFRLNLVWAGLFAYYWVENEKSREQHFLLKELEVTQLKELKTKADLEALQAKINPHFLYNSLNSIANAIDDEPQKAKQMTLLLSRFFRFTTNAQSQYYWTLAEELDLVRTYLSIEKIRFGERLDFRIPDLDSDLSACIIPRFLIQPLAENTIKHSISKMPDKGIMGIQINSDNDFIELKIYDNGQPFQSGFQYGYGLRSVNEKIKLLGGENASFAVFNESPTNQEKYHENPTKYILVHLPKKYA